MAQSLEEFVEDRPRLELFRAKLEPLVNELLAAADINFHIVESRTKSIESYAEKIKNPTKGYTNSDKIIPDVVGCRIIVYYHDDVEKVANIIKTQFEVIEEELSHQQSAIDADRFGYLSAHYVIKLSDSRNYLTEWSKYKDCHAEVQIRTVVQHAWSAVSHALQYKKEAGVPSQLQRRLFRIAGIFELADEEFVGIRDQKTSIDESAKKQIESGSVKIPISSATISAFSSNWFKKQDIASKLVKAGFILNPDGDQDDEYIPEIYDLAVRGGVKYIDEMEAKMSFDAFPILKAFVESAEKKSWSGSPEFAFLLCSIVAFKNIVNKTYLESNDWGDEAIKIITDKLFLLSI